MSLPLNRDVYETYQVLVCPRTLWDAPRVRVGKRPFRKVLVEQAQFKDLLSEPK